jgi:hypothetical protein
MSIPRSEDSPKPFCKGCHALSPLSTDYLYTIYTLSVKLIGPYSSMSRQVELTHEEIKRIIAILRFSKDACPIESLPENIDDDEVERLVSKFEKTLVTSHVVYNT